MTLEKNKHIEPWWQPAISLFAQISAWIVFPILLALFIGRWLDDRYDREPFFILLCVGLAFAVTMFGLIKQTAAAMKKIDKANKEKKS